LIIRRIILTINEFNSGASCLDDNGEFFMGGMGGLVGFFPDLINENELETFDQRILINEIKVSALPKTLVIPHSKGFDVLKISEIIMCVADGYCTNIFVTGDRKYISSKNLKHFDEMLDEHNIIRVHHSYLVNINHVISYSRQGEIRLTEGNKAYLGDSYKNYFIKRFGGKQ
jgi:DNA-binding LytR/AlgR family response regulator